MGLPLRLYEVVLKVREEKEHAPLTRGCNLLPSSPASCAVCISTSTVTALKRIAPSGGAWLHAMLSRGSCWFLCHAQPDDVAIGRRSMRTESGGTGSRLLLTGQVPSGEEREYEHGDQSKASGTDKSAARSVLESAESSWCSIPSRKRRATCEDAVFTSVLVCSHVTESRGFGFPGERVPQGRSTLGRG